MNSDLFESGLWCRMLVRWSGDRDMLVECGQLAKVVHVFGSNVHPRCLDHFELNFGPGWEALDLDTYAIHQVMES